MHTKVARLLYRIISLANLTLWGKTVPVKLARSTIRVFEPSELAPEEKEILLSALEAFVNLGGKREDFLAFGKMNPNFFPVPIRDESQTGRTPLPDPCFSSTIISSVNTEDEGKKLWTKAVAWEPVCHKLCLFYRNSLRRAWHPPLPGPWDVSTGEEFEILLGLTPHQYAGRDDGALEVVLYTHPGAKLELQNRIMADWKTGTFLYDPANDFQRAVYILFREGWRAKVCERCSRRFVADKPVQRYCSTHCSGDAKKGRGRIWWNKHGRQWRARRKAFLRRKCKRSEGKRGE
jgi:hypothetical protein